MVSFLPACTLSLVLAPLSSHEISFEETRPLIDGSLEVARAAKGSLLAAGAHCLPGREAAGQLWPERNKDRRRHWRKTT